MLVLSAVAVPRVPMYPVDDGPGGGLAGGDVIATGLDLNIGGQRRKVAKSHVVDHFQGVLSLGADLNFELLVRFPDLGDPNQSPLDVRPGLELVLPFLFKFNHLLVVHR